MVIKVPVPPEKREMSKFFKICEMARIDKIKTLVIMDENEWELYLKQMDELKKRVYGDVK